MQTADPTVRRALVGTALTLSYTHRDEYGEPTDAASEPPTVAAVLASTGASVTVGAVDTGTDADGVYTATIAAADNTTLDDLVVTWTADGAAHVQTYRIVGAFYIDLTTADDDAGLYPGSEPTTARRRRARDAAEAECERITRRYFTPRAITRTIHNPTPAVLLKVPDTPVRTLRSVLELNDDGTTAATWTAGQLAAVDVDRYGLLRAHGLWFPAGRLRLTYEYGFDCPPGDIVEAVTRRYRYWLTRPASAVPDRAESWSEAEGGASYRLMAGRDRTGDTDVDGIYWSYQRARLGAV